MLKKLALFSIFELFCLLLTSSLSKYASKRGVEALNFVSPPLVDFFHEMLPFHEEGPFLSDVCVLIIMGIFLWAIWRSHSVIELTIEFLGLHSILLLLRITSITLTILPSPVPVCRDIQRFESCSWCKDIRDLIPTLSASYCNDLMFSGHTMTMLLCTLFTQNSNIHFVAKILSWISLTCGCIGLLIGHYHYSADLFISIVITSLLFRCSANVSQIFKTKEQKSRLE